MVITSKVNSGFKIDGILILPGTRNYKQLDASKREVRYQLGILKAEGHIDFKEAIVTDVKELPFVKEEKKKAVVKVAEPIKQPVKKAKKNK